MSFYKRSIRDIKDPLLVSVYHRMGDHNENQLCKDFYYTKNKLTQCLCISAQQTSRLRLRESLQADTWSLCLGFISLIALPTCLLFKTSL